MAERHSDRVHPEMVVLDIGRDVGALIIYTESGRHGEEIEIGLSGSDQKRVHVEVLERRINDRPVFAAVFFGLRAGDYDIWDRAATPSASVTVVGGEVTNLDWRRSP
jgi:hypothetical protein